MSETLYSIWNDTENRWAMLSCSIPSYITDKYHQYASGPGKPLGVLEDDARKWFNSLSPIVGYAIVGYTTYSIQPISGKTTEQRLQAEDRKRREKFASRYL